MKEMVGGCCVCSDERGWAENPLVYCDGQGCNVAVHQACYGIVQVPTGPWFCRRCESQERAARVKCELCPLKDGALKRTDTTGWCHVVCALFIPEAWFANVQTMEPIVLKNVPPDRFNRMCYICEENGKEASKSSSGACMQCNKNGCKQNFHVTCAQAHGLLCEEQGNYGDNVKYCGYCAYHYKKLKKDAHIKTIPAFKPIPSDNATPDSTPEKSYPMQASGGDYPKVKTSAECKSMDPSILAHAQGQGQDCEVLRSRLKLQSPPIHLKPASVRVIQPDSSSPSPSSLTTMTAIGSADSTGGPTSILMSADSSGNLTDSKLIMEAKFTVPSESTGKLFATTTGLPSVTIVNPVTTNLAGFAVPLDSTNLTLSAPTNSVIVPQTSALPGVEAMDTSTSIPAARGRRPRSGSLEKDKKLKKVRVPSLAANKNLSSIKVTEGDEAPPTSGAGRRGRKKSGSVGSTPTSANPNIGSQNFSVFGGEPRFQSPISLSSFSQGETGSLSTLSALASLSQGSLVSSSDKMVNGTDGIHGPPKVFPSQLAGKEGQSNDMSASIEDFLEKQWNQGAHFLMEQGKNFDIASLLNCLHKLKDKNRQLEEYVRSLMARRDQLLAYNGRLGVPNPAGAASASGEAADDGSNSPVEVQDPLGMSGSLANNVHLSAALNLSSAGSIPGNPHLYTDPLRNHTSLNLSSASLLQSQTVSLPSHLAITSTITGAGDQQQSDGLSTNVTYISPQNIQIINSTKSKDKT